MNAEYREIHSILLDLYAMINQPKRDTSLLAEAGVTLDRALFPLLIGVERRGPIGVVELAGFFGRDHTTVSRQVAKLEELGLIRRQSSKVDSRIKEATITARGQTLADKITVAREARATRALKDWSKKDLMDLARLMRRLADDLMALD